MCGSAFEVEIYDGGAERILTINMQTDSSWTLVVSLFHRCRSASSVGFGGGRLQKGLGRCRAAVLAACLFIYWWETSGGSGVEGKMSWAEAGVGLQEAAVVWCVWCWDPAALSHLCEVTCSGKFSGKSLTPRPMALPNFSGRGRFDLDGLFALLIKCKPTGIWLE